MFQKLCLIGMAVIGLSSFLQATVDETLRFARAHQEFRDLYFKDNEQEFMRLTREGQSPQTLFIGCSDSRVVPDLILGTRPGDLFVVRTAGNFVPPLPASFTGDGVAATIQYAIEALNVKHIVVCGHSHCGAIKGLFQNLDNQKFGILKKWLRFGEEARQLTLNTVKPQTPAEEVYQVAEYISVIYQLEHLMSYPFIKQRVENGTLALHGWYYKIEAGTIEYYDPRTYSFKSLSSVLKKEPIESSSPVEVE